MIAILRKPDAFLSSRLGRAQIKTVVSDGWELQERQTLFLGSTPLQPDLLPHGFQYLEQWDVVAPLHSGIAKDQGTPSERRRTQEVCLDLRVPVYAHEVLFVRDSEAGRAFLSTWRSECAGGANERLAFVRALHLVKPLFLALPRSWVIAEAQAKTAPAEAQAKTAPKATPLKRKPLALVRVEISPGRSVLCHPGEEETVKARFAAQHLKRADRRKLENAIR